ncbi:MAG: hypothetical protein FWF94_05580 [Oscillospiraceae bacterium]|nr:hypothetical protein [Oscillospiraceae bacterium]
MLRYSEKTNRAELNLKLFDVDEKQEAEQKRNQQIRKKKYKDPNSSISKKGNWIALIFIASCVLCIFTIYNTGKIDLERVNAENSAVTRKLEEAVKENLRLQAVLDSLATPAKIDEYAAKNGLVKVQTSNQTIVYVNVEKATEVAHTRNKDALSVVTKWFNEGLEFLGLR